MHKKIGFVGLGVMGAPMAGHLVNAGHQVVVWNRTAAKAQPLLEAGAQVAESLGDLAKECSVVILCVSRTEDVRDCLAELTQTAQPGTLFVDHSTIDPGEAKKIHEELREKGLRFIDAPITGGSMGAQKGALTIFLGGDEKGIEEAIPIMACYTKRAERVGGPGAGQMAKMANQIAVGGALIGLCECLNFAAKAGLDMALMRDMIGSGAGGSWAFENYGPKILNNDWSPGFSIDNQLKDFKYCIAAAEQIDAAIPGTELLDRLLTLKQGRGEGAQTTAALFELLQEMHGQKTEAAR